jgi:hypothetical protein
MTAILFYDIQTEYCQLLKKNHYSTAELEWLE